MHTSALDDVDGLYQINTGKKRRTFLKALVASGSGIAGIRLATKKAFGDEPDGVPIVWRRDKYGNPETVRFIPKERKRRINAFYNLDTSTFRNKVDNINNFSLVELSDDPTDLGLKVSIEEKTPEVQRALPDEIHGMPVVIKEEKREVEENSCDKFISNYFDPLPANVEVQAKFSDGTHDEGTLGIVCYNDDSNDPYECYIAAEHVFYNDSLGEASTYMYQSGEDSDGNYVQNEKSGVFEKRYDGMDGIKYRRRSGTANADIRANASDKLKDLQGVWDYQGLTDAVSGTSTVGVEFAGRETCYQSTECYNTFKDGEVDYGAEFNDTLQSGDSGGPYVDYDGYLVAIHHGNAGSSASGPVADELLYSLNASLYHPDLTQ